MLSSYTRMQVTDMSNRPQHGWQLRSMSTIMKIAVMIFVALLCFVGFIGAFGMINSGNTVTEDLPGPEFIAESSIAEAQWLLRLDDEAADKSSPLIFFDDQSDLKRPSFVPHYKKQLVSSDPFAELAADKIRKLDSLRARNLTFIINVIGWRRRASLKRLVQSLERANYHGFTTRMHFHLDGEAHPLVTEFVEEYQWPHGKTAMNLHTERLGLETTIFNSWDARNDNQLAFFFEDDIEVSPNYFEYAMLVLQEYIYPDPNGPRSDSYLASKMMGVSLNTPRFNEIVYPPYRWVPQHVIGQDDYQFAFQLANSWGCLYFPWIWREYRMYYNWRKQAGIGLTEKIVPNSFINNWERSWKKSLIELSYFRGYYMIHPNLPGQHGFSIHHREPGEHTGSRRKLGPIVDLMDDLYLDYFTIPLASNERDINRLFSTMKPLGELPVVNYHHAAVEDIYSLVNDWLSPVQILETHGFDFDAYNSNPGCLLDNLSPPVLYNAEDAGPKYLIYQGQGSAFDQLLALENAFAVAKLLDRTLIIPPLTYENKKFQQATWDWLIDLRSLISDNPWTPVMTLDEMSGTKIWLDRMVDYKLETTSSPEYNDKLFDKYGIVPMRNIPLHRIPSAASDVKKSFGRCFDKYIGFRSLISSFKQHDDPSTEREFRSWANKKLALKKPFSQVYDEILASFKKPYGCVAFTRGDDPGNCGRGDPFSSPDLGKLVSFRSCNATAPRTIEYLISTAESREIDLGSIYIITDDGTPPTAMPNFAQGKGSEKISIFRSSYLTDYIRKSNVLHSEIRHMVQDIQKMFQEKLCSEADVFLGNVYSESSRRIVRVRKGLEKSSDVLGFKSDEY